MADTPVLDTGTCNGYGSSSLPSRTKLIECLCSSMVEHRFHKPNVDCSIQSSSTKNASIVQRIRIVIS